MASTVLKVVVPLVVTVLPYITSYLIKKAKQRAQRPPRPPNTITREEMIRRARDKLGMELVGFLNFAFCGPQGSGKSSLINSLRGLHDPDPNPIAAEQYDELDSAPTGETETTQETRRYGYPIDNELEFVRFWDHPGCGTQNHPVETYFDDKVLYAYDCVLLVTAGVLGQYERSIIEAARTYGTDVVIVVNKAEQRVESKIRRRPRNADPLNENTRRMLIQETIDEAKQSINNTLDDIQHDQVPIFVVSAWKWYEYQNTQLINDKEMSMEIGPLFEHLINAALARRAP